MGRTKGSTNKKFVASNSNVTLAPKAKKVPLTESETVVNFMGGENKITIGTNHQTLLKKLLSVKAPDTTMEDGYASFSFNLDEYNFSFLPKKKRKGRKPSPEQVEKMRAGRDK